VATGRETIGAVGLMFVGSALFVSAIMLLSRRPTGWTTPVMSFTTCTILGFLILIGEWDPVPEALAASVGGAAILAVLALVSAACRSRQSRSDAVQVPRPPRHHRPGACA
jgi:hypothetical protein